MKKNLWCLLTLMLFCINGFSQNLNVIEKELQEVLNQRNDEMIDVSIVFKSQINSAKLQAKAEKNSDRSTRREFVVDELKEFSLKKQSDVMSYLQAEEKGGRVSNINSLWIVNSISCKATKDVIYRLSSHPDVAVLTYNKEVQLLDESKAIEMNEDSDNNRGGSAAPHVIQINADDVWNQGYTGKNVIVAVLDSGTNTNHYDLKDHLWTGYIDTDDDGNPDTYVNGWNFISNNSNITDDYGHGTHCAGIVCGDGTIGNTVGMAPDASLMTVKIVNRAGGGSVAQMLSGVQFAVENGADVLSMSLGFKNNQVTAEQKKQIRQTFDNVLTAGVVVCAAAGNDGNSYVALENIDYPAACPSPWMNPDQLAINNGGLSSVICVGNVNGNNSLVASSSRGPVTWQDVDSYNDYPYNGTTQLGLIRPDICAPGELVYSLKHDQANKYKYMSGTSQATPGVAGVIALMLEKNSDLTPAQICEIIETTASNKPATKNNQVGSGVIDALSAVNAVTAGNDKPYLKITRQSPSSMAIGNAKSINITLTNQGKASCENGSATLISDDQYVTITSATSSFGSIAVNGTADISFTINLSEETPNGHTAAFTLMSTDGTLTWSEDFTIKIDSYSKILYQSCQTAELVEGENTLSVKMINKGTVATTQNTDVKLTTNSSFVTINNNVSTLGTMNVGAEETATFTVTVNEGTPDHTNINFDLYSTPNNYLEKRNITYEFESELDQYGSPTDGFNGWTTFDNSADGRNHPWWHSQNAETHKVAEIGSFHSGKGQLMSETYCQASMQEYTMPIDNFLVSPKIKATSDSKISFFARTHSDFPGERFQVLVSEASNNIASDFTLLNSYVIDGDGYDEWKEYTVDLSAYNGKEIYVAIRHYFTAEQWAAVDNGYLTYILHIDDVTFYDVIDASDNFKYDNYSYFSITVKADPLPAPANVNATANGTSSIDLTWDAVTHAQKYNIYRDGEYIAYTTSTSYTDNNLTHNTQYCYYVSAVYSGYEYDKSEEACATTVQKAESAAITSVSPQTFDVDGETTIPLKLTITNDGSSRFKARASYTLSSDNAYVTIANNADYISALQPGASVEKTINVTVKEDIPNASVINFNLNILSGGTQDNEMFEFNIPFSVDVYNPLRAPKNLAANNPGASSIPLTWDAAPNATSYDVYRNGTKIANTSSTMYVDNGLDAETQYCYKVKSIKGNEMSDFSDELCVTTLAEDNGIVVQSFNFVEDGETATLAVTLVNKTGAATVETTTATLTTEDQYVEIVNGTAALGSVAANGTATAEFIVKLDASTPENHNIAFNITVESEGMGYDDVQYTFDSGFDGWTNYKLTQNYTWEYASSNGTNGTGCIKSYSYKNGDRTPDNLICSPVKIKMSDKSQIIWDVASSYSGSNNYYKEHYGVYITSVDPAGTNGWEVTNTVNELGNPIYEETLTANHKNYNFIETTANASSAADTEVWVVFRHFDCTGQDAIVVDNIKITNVPMLTSVTYYNSITVTTTAVEPVELTAVANGVDKVNLSWNTVARAESYNIYRDNAFLANTTETSYTDNNLTHNTTYYYQVAAVSNGVEYSHSEKVYVTTEQKDYSVIFSASPEEIDVLGLTTATISFTILNDGANTINANYTLTCDNAYVTIVNGTGNIEALQNGAEITKTVDVKIAKNVTDGSVIAFNLNLSSQNFSIDNAFEITMNNPSRVPTNLVVNSSTDAYSLTLSWDAVDGATSYNVYRGGEFVGNTSSINYVDKGLTPGTGYCYQVSSMTGTVESDLSVEACGTTSTIEGQVIVQSCDITEQGNVVTLTATLINNSNAETPEGTTATLSCKDQYVTLINANAEVGALAIGATKNVVFTLELANNTPSNYELDFDVIVEATGSTSNLTYNFDDSDEGWYPLDWNNSGNDKNNGWEYEDGQFRSYSFKYGVGTLNPNNLLISPESASITANSKLKFNVSSIANTAFYEHYYVYVTKIYPNGGWSMLESGNMILIYEETLQQAAVQNKEISLSDYAGENIWIIFRHWNCSDQYAIALDNVEITNVSSGGGAGFVHTSSLTVTVNQSLNMFAGTGSWTEAGKWSKGSVPTSTDDVIIKGDVTMESGDVTVNSLTIYNGYSLTMNEGAKLTVNGAFVNEDAAALIINDGAQIVQSSENVMATFKMNIENPTNWSEQNVTGWQFISTPIKNAKFDTFVPGMNEGDYDLYKYDGSAELEWVNHKASNAFGTNFKQGVGYMASYEEKEIAEFTGSLNHESSYNFTVTYNDEKDLANFHLLGNPFTFNMDWSDVKFNNLVNGYAVVNLDGGYDYATTGEIKVGDGFFVYATAEDPSISYGVSKGQSYRGEKAQSINLIATGNAGSDNVIISMSGAEKEGFPKLDNFNENIANVYVADNSVRYGIYNCDENVTEIPVCFEAKKIGNYSISVEVEGEFEGVVLIDRLTGVETNMLIEDEYGFTATINDNYERFLIRIVERIEKSDIFAHQNGEELIIDAEGTIQIIDVMGRMVYNNDVESSNNRINVSNLKGSTYIIRNVSDNGVRTQKIVII